MLLLDYLATLDCTAAIAARRLQSNLEWKSHTHCISIFNAKLQKMTFLTVQ